MLRKTPTSSTSLTRTYTSDTCRIEQIIDRIHEIERKLEIVKMQNISEEAKNITINELEEEKTARRNKKVRILGRCHKRALHRIIFKHKILL